jgi:hypothetical protein
MIINEEDQKEENKDTKSTTVVKDTDADANKEKAKEQKNNVKYVNWYLAGNTDVFSAKMKILRQRYLDYAKIFKAVFIDPEKKEKEGKAEYKLKGKNKYKMKDSIEI